MSEGAITKDRQKDDDESFFKAKQSTSVVEEDTFVPKKQLDPQTRMQREILAEQEAHRKDKDILDFERQLLNESSDSSSEDQRNSHSLHQTKDVQKSNEIQEEETRQSGKSSGKCLRNIIKAIAYWDLTMCLVTYMHYQREAMNIEFLTIRGYYNCPQRVKLEKGVQMKWLFILHSCSCMALLYSLSKKEASLMTLWFITKVLTLAYFGFRQAYDLRLKEGHQLFRPGKIYFFLVALTFYCVQIVCVAVQYMKYTKPYIERRRLLQSSRTLNRDIQMKILPPFLQRKYAVRWAEKLQTMIVLEKTRAIQKETKKQSLLKDGDMDFNLDLETGIQAFRSAYGFDSKDILGEERRSKRSNLSRFSKHSRHAHHHQHHH